MSMNQLILGDNLEILKTVKPESIDLIYLDPPFFSNRNYEVIWGDAGEVRSFQDRWGGGIDHYIAWLKERVECMHRLLKPTGSIFLHCDWHANTYIRTFILDKIFGMNNFINEIVWCYKKWVSSKNQLCSNHDIIFWYAKSKLNEYHYNQLYTERAESTLKRFGTKKIISGDKDKSGKRIPSVTAGEDSVGVKLGDWWDMPIIAPSAKERIGYPMQKPEALLERIITCASNPGDIVLDPFMGGGTTIAVADRLKRRWIGIDQSVQAVKVSELRLQKQQDLFSNSYTLQLHKYDYDTLRYKDVFKFESWIVQQFGGIPNIKQQGNSGIDGKMPDGVPIQVKRSGEIGRNVIDNFIEAVQRFDKNLFEKNNADDKITGYIIAFSFDKGTVQEVARLKNEANIVIKLVPVEEIIPIAVKPSIDIHINELSRDSAGIRKIEFIAVGESPVGIEFYSWDFNYEPEKGFKPDIFIDREGKQLYSCEAGIYNIAVKVVDNDGLENMEIIRLSVNGVVTVEN
ncbi:hypothetical protein FACS1894172_20200 [Spirochaetia bacterium]|nr:hypothetical protein FACS1894164_16420 [Spirochaetia bacterium]GHU36953.1 hypothetical protein FACS1894172_20200 [Spirochaetia bacterium]